MLLPESQWLSDVNAVAIRMNDEPLTYRQLQTSVHRLLTQLLPYRAQPVFAVASGNAWLTCLLVHACARLNKPLYVLGPDFSAARLQGLLSRSGCSLLITDQQEPELPSAIQQLDAGLLLSGQAEDAELDIPVAAVTSGVQLIVATSGSSGEPKGVMLSVAALQTSARAVNARLGLRQGDCWLNCMPLYHIAGLAIVFRCHFAAATMLLHQGFDADRVWRDLQQHNVTHISLAPAMLWRLLELSADTRPPACLRVVLVGGAALSEKLARRAHAAGWPLAISYGMTETASMCALDASADAGLVAGRVGQPLPGFDITVAPEQGNLLIEGEALMSGYANPELRAGDGLVDGRFSSSDNGWFDEEGCLHITGRSDDVLVSGGRSVHPREVEEQLEVYTGRGKVAVGSLPDPVWGDLLVAAFTAGDFDIDDFADWTRQHLASAIRPRRFVQLDSLPLSPLGKLDRARLREIIQQQGT